MAYDADSGHRGRGRPRHPYRLLGPDLVGCRHPGPPEIAELSEPVTATRGGSSSMPHKRNPVLSELIRPAAMPAPQLAATLHTLARRTVVAGSQCGELLAGLGVHPLMMAENLRRTDVLDEQRVIAVQGTKAAPPARLRHGRRPARRRPAAATIRLAAFAHLHLCKLEPLGSVRDESAADVARMPHVVDNEAFCGKPPRSVRGPTMREERDEIESTGESAGRRREALRLLRASSNPMSILAIADALGVHPNTVRFHLDVLVAGGQVEQVAPGRKGPGRPPLMFQAVRQMDRGGTRRYRLLAEILSTALAAERNSAAKALTAGRTWGLRMELSSDGDVGAEESVDHLVDMLDELGFAPERRAADGDQQIGLRHCPFLELAENRSAIVCPIHLGLMQGAMETWGAQVTVDRLEAFVEPDLCVAHLSVEGTANGAAR